VEGAGQLHLDLLGLLAITAGLLNQSTGRRVWGAAGWAFASLCKWNDLITAPWFWLAGTRTLGQRLKSAGLLAVVLAAMSAAAFAPFLRSPASLRQSFQALFAKTVVPGGTVVDIVAGGVLVVIALTLASPKFQSWYLMSALPFFGLGCPPVWRRWWPWAIFFSVTEEFALVLPRTAFLFVPLVCASTAMTAAVCLWSFRARFWRALAPTAGDASTSHVDQRADGRPRTQEVAEGRLRG
jgi:hypothetical protein